MSCDNPPTHQNDGYIFVYTTTSSHSEAAHIARTLVDEHLAACANIFPQVRSIYRWQEQTEESDDNVLILKTRSALFNEISARIKALHSQILPCIVALPIVAGDGGYLSWISDNTKTRNT